MESGGVVLKSGKCLMMGLLVTLMLSCAGCQQKLYDWGSYEASILRMYKGGSELKVADEIDRLKREIEKTESAGRIPAPGKQAHLGYLYYLAGDRMAAKQAFEAEAAAFPESRVFMMRLAENAQ